MNSFFSFSWFTFSLGFVRFSDNSISTIARVFRSQRVVFAITTCCLCNHNVLSSRFFAHVLITMITPISRNTLTCVDNQRVRWSDKMAGVRKHPSSHCPTVPLRCFQYAEGVLPMGYYNIKQGTIYLLTQDNCSPIH